MCLQIDKLNLKVLVCLTDILLCHFQISDRSEIGSIRRDAGGDREQHSCSPSQAEEKVPQPVDPQDQQHRAGSLWPAERDAGVTGEKQRGKRHGQAPAQLKVKKPKMVHVNKVRERMADVRESLAPFFVVFLEWNRIE